MQKMHSRSAPAILDGISADSYAILVSVLDRSHSFAGLPTWNETDSDFRLLLLFKKLKDTIVMLFLSSLHVARRKNKQPKITKENERETEFRRWQNNIKEAAGNVCKFESILKLRKR